MSDVSTEELTLDVGTKRVSAILDLPPEAWTLYVMAHGAGAGMRHRFMERTATELTARGIATLRYQFPYMEQGRKRPDWPRVLTATVRAAVRLARERVPSVPLVAGGKSLGGRMTSAAQAEDALPDVSALVFLGFPLHPPKKPGTDRAAHLGQVAVPMLFVQGTRDALADLTLLRPVSAALGPRATLHIVDGGDHSFNVLKRSGRTNDEVTTEIGQTIHDWIRATALGGKA